jgi:hypothetical protein
MCEANCQDCNSCFPFDQLNFLSYDIGYYVCDDCSYRYNDVCKFDICKECSGPVDNICENREVCLECINCDDEEEDQE